MPSKKHEFGMALSISLLLFLHLPFVRGYIETVKFTDDSREQITFGLFGFTTTGRLSISVSSVHVTPAEETIPPNFSRFGFYTAPTFQDVNPNIRCKKENKDLTKVFTFSEIPPPPQSSLSKTISVTKPGRYNIAFGNCDPGSSVSMLVHIEAYNLDAKGQKNYLSDGVTYLPTIFFIFTLCYVPFLQIWLLTCHLNKKFVKKIHILMLVLLLFKALNLAVAAEENYHIQVWGSPRGWDTLFYISHFINAMLLFTIALLIGTGWSFLKPSLQEREKRLLMVGFVLQVFGNVAYILFIDTKDYSRHVIGRTFFWLFCFVIADAISAALIFISISWSLRSIRETAKVDGKALSDLKKMRGFRNFYVAVLVFLVFKNYLMPFIAFNVRALYHNYLWVCVFIVELISLMFYITVFYWFRPVGKNQYFAPPRVPPDYRDEEAALATINSYEFEDYDCVQQLFSSFCRNWRRVLLCCIISVLATTAHVYIDQYIDNKLKID